MKDREAIFIEFITAMRKREKEDSKSRGEKVWLKYICKVSFFWNKNVVVFFREVEWPWVKTFAGFYCPADLPLSKLLRLYHLPGSCSPWFLDKFLNCFDVCLLPGEAWLLWPPKWAAHRGKPAVEQSEREARDGPTLQGCGELRTQRRSFQTVHGKTSQGRSSSDLQERRCDVIFRVDVNIAFYFCTRVGINWEWCN